MRPERSLSSCAPCRHWPSESLLLDADAPLRASSSSVVNRFGPGTRCAGNIGRAEPEALDVGLDNEVATSPVVRHLGSVGVRLEEPTLVTEVIDRLVLGDDSKSLGPAP